MQFTVLLAYLITTGIDIAGAGDVMGVVRHWLHGTLHASTDGEPGRLHQRLCHIACSQISGPVSFDFGINLPSICCKL